MNRDEYYDALDLGWRSAVFKYPKYARPIYFITKELLDSWHRDTILWRLMDLNLVFSPEFLALDEGH